VLKTCTSLRCALGDRPRNLAPAKLRPLGYGAIIASGNYCPAELPLAILWAKGLSLNNFPPGADIETREGKNETAALMGNN
jgi:hypothetical protein